MVVSNMFYFHPAKLGKWSNLTVAYFSNGLVQPPTSIYLTSVPTKKLYEPAMKSRQQWMMDSLAYECFPCKKSLIQMAMEHVTFLKIPKIKREESFQNAIVSF